MGCGRAIMLATRHMTLLGSNMGDRDHTPPPPPPPPPPRPLRTRLRPAPTNAGAGSSPLARCVAQRHACAPHTHACKLAAPQPAPDIAGAGSWIRWRRGRCAAPGGAGRRRLPAMRCAARAVSAPNGGPPVHPRDRPPQAHRLHQQHTQHPHRESPINAGRPRGCEPGSGRAGSGRGGQQAAAALQAPGVITAQRHRQGGGGTHRSCLPFPAPSRPRPRLSPPPPPRTRPRIHLQTHPHQTRGPQPLLPTPQKVVAAAGRRRGLGC